MPRLSNPQGIMFVEVVEADVSATSVGGWLGQQQRGQTKVIISSAVTAQKGIVTHTVGDALLCSFPKAADAVKAAVKIRETFPGKADAKSKLSKFGVRIGLAYGPVLVAGGKVTGDAVMAAGMLYEAAESGEILVDETLQSVLASDESPQFKQLDPIETRKVYRLIAAAAKSGDMVGSATIPVLDPDPELKAAAPQKKPAPPPPAQAPAQVPAKASAKAPVQTPARKAAVAPEKPRPEPTPKAKPAAINSNPSLSLTLIYNDTPYKLNARTPQLSIGRNTDNDIVVPGKYVSRYHLKVNWSATAITLEILSTNGICIRLDSEDSECRYDKSMTLTGTGTLGLAPRFKLAGEDTLRFELFGEI